MIHLSDKENINQIITPELMNLCHLKGTDISYNIKDDIKPDPKGLEEPGIIPTERRKENGIIHGGYISPFILAKALEFYNIQSELKDMVKEDNHDICLFIHTPKGRTFTVRTRWVTNNKHYRYIFEKEKVMIRSPQDYYILAKYHPKINESLIFPLLMFVGGIDRINLMKDRAWSVRFNQYNYQFLQEKLPNMRMWLSEILEVPIDEIPYYKDCIDSAFTNEIIAKDEETRNIGVKNKEEAKEPKNYQFTLI